MLRNILPEVLPLYLQSDLLGEYSAELCVCVCVCVCVLKYILCIRRRLEWYVLWVSQRGHRIGGTVVDGQLRQDIR